MISNDDDPPLSDEYLEADSFAASVEAKLEMAAMREAEERHVVWLCDNGREDDPVDGGMPAWFYKALYVDEP